MDDLDDILLSERNLENNDDSSDSNSTEAATKPKLPLVTPMCVGSPKESGFHQSTRMCLEHIRDAMLHHRWQEAADYMAYYPQVLEDTTHSSEQQHKEVVWRLSTEILHHLPNSTLADYNNVYERMKHSGVRHYLTICLEHAFHLMLHGHLEEAKRQLSAGESWRYGKESAAQHQTIKLIQAYRSLLDYITWSEKKFACSSEKYLESDNQSMHSYFRQASVNLREILKCPGVWDPFIVSYVEMLEFYNDQEEALKVLYCYANDDNFPPNPNAQVYLYQYLKQHDTHEKKLLKVLKVLHGLVPSHELMLEYINLLLQSGKAAKALGVVLDMLDFACWKNNVDVWKDLKRIIQQVQTKADWEGVVSEKMAVRKDWWPPLHFTSFHARQDAEENPELYQAKASLTKVLHPDLPLKYNTGQGTSG